MTIKIDSWHLCMSDPKGVLDLVRELHMGAGYHLSVLTDALLERRAAYERSAGLNLVPLVEALVAQDDFYTHSADCVDEDCREEERLEGIAMSKRHVALTDLQEQLQEKAGD